MNRPKRRKVLDPVRKQPQSKRNERCPCGSGLKYKQCHGKQTANAN